MRRSDREVTDFHDKLEIIGRCQVFRIAIWGSEGPYIVPMNFGYETVEEELILYFHSAKAGRKIDMLTANPKVAFEMDVPYGVIEGETACRYSFRYESVIGQGCVELIQSPEGKLHGLNKILSNVAGFQPKTYEKKWLNAVNVFRISVTGFTAKRRV